MTKMIELKLNVKTYEITIHMTDVNATPAVVRH